MATNMSQVTPSKAEKMLKRYEDRLKEIRSIDLEGIKFSEVCELTQGFEKEMETLDSKKAAILSMGTRAYLRDRYLIIIRDYNTIIGIPNLLDEMERSLSSLWVTVYHEMRIKLSQLYQEFDTKISNKILPVSLKNNFYKKYDQHLQKFSQIIIDNVLPIQIKDSLFYIERTLAEPSLYSLNGLIMWMESADHKIKIIPDLFSAIPEVPKQIEGLLLKRYKSLRKKLKAEILKMRTYPIPEPWCSTTMKKGVTHIIEGEFIFYVKPEIEEDMKSVNPSERDLLPGGITRQEYDTRLDRLNMEYAIARDDLESRNADELEKKCAQMEDWYAKYEEEVIFIFEELSLLYRDSRSLGYLVNKNEDDKLLKIVHEIILRRIRHYYDNRIDISSFAITINNEPMIIAPPKEERNIPTASGIDRGGEMAYQLDTPAGIIVYMNCVIIADRYGDTVSSYRTSDLASIRSHHDSELADTPVSLTYFQPSVFVCYSSLLVQFSLTWIDRREIYEINREQIISIAQACCTSSNREHLYVGTLKPSIIRMQLDPLRVEQEYPLNPILYTKTRNRYPWLQEMRAILNCIICLFTGSPSPLQLFSLEGELIRSLLTEDQIVGAYNFNLFWNPITNELRIYICDFWENSVKIFDMFGKFIGTVCETGHGLCQIFRPTSIFIENSGYITVCDMKVDNCLQIL